MPISLNINHNRQIINPLNNKSGSKNRNNNKKTSLLEGFLKYKNKDNKIKIKSNSSSSHNSQHNSGSLYDY